MKVTSADVRPGKCFLSAGPKPQVLRVLAVHDGLVRFETKARRKAWSGRGETAVAEFVGGLVKEVGSDYEPEEADAAHP